MFPHFTSINKDIFANILSSGKGLLPNTSNIIASTELFPFIRIISGTGGGLIMVANENIPNIVDVAQPTKDADGKIIPPKNSPSLYGSKENSGILGKNWLDEPVFPFDTPFTGNLVLRPSPIITDLEVKEGKDQISRSARVVVKCFSLAQAEMMQEYLMEPGHSILIEYGWNTNKAASQLIQLKNLENNTPLPDDTISINVAESNLNAEKLQTKRIASCGDYDSFFGFIVGGTMTSESDTYILTIELRGMPGLPTYLQLHENINQINEEVNADGKVIGRKIKSNPEAPLYNQNDIKKKDNSSINMGERRWKWMFNKLPATRQTFEVQKLIDSISSKDSENGWWDLINFDYLINNQIADFIDDDVFDTIKKFIGLEPELATSDGVIIPKERLITENRYIRFEKALEILNRNNGLYSYEIGSKKVKVRIETKSFIGAFPRIFSTKPSKLIIPGKIPDFVKYYCNTEAVNLDDIINSEIDNSIMVSTKTVGPYVTKTYASQPLFYNQVRNIESEKINHSSKITEKISFVQYSADGKGLRPAAVDPKDSTKGNYMGYTEKDGYYGELGNLYLNFGIFIDALKNSSNKSIREVLMDMLNEMSSAVNSFWNFQIVEGTDEKGDYVLRIIDENWSGKNASTIRNFVHAGEKSVFLDASLSIDIPSETTNQIILKRQDYISNPNAKNLSVGGIFSAKTDKFFKGVEYVKNKATDGTKTPAAGKKITSSDLKIEIDTIMNSVPNIETKENLTTGITITIARDDEMNEVFRKKTLATSNTRTYENVQPNNNNEQGVKLQEKITEYRQKLKDEEEAKNTNLNSNLAKIEVLPNPERFNISTEALSIERYGADLFHFNFKIYCCDDTQLFDIMKNNAYEKYILEETNATSHPLPIKYSFKILGRSGIRRGDIFNVYGIPKKYRDFGFFQTIQVDHTFSENKWTTEVSGQFRQQKQ